MSLVSNGLYFLTVPLVSVMRVIYRKIRHARYLYIKKNVEKTWGARYTLGARYLSKKTVISIHLSALAATSVVHNQRSHVFLTSAMSHFSYLSMDCIGTDTTAAEMYERCALCLPYVSMQGELNSVLEFDYFHPVVYM